MSTLPEAGAERATARPSTAIASLEAARSPSWATRPATLTRPAAIQVSISRREPRPARASSFCRRSGCSLPFSAGGGADFGFGLGEPFSFGDGFRIGGTHTGFSGRSRLECECLGDLLERRQLLERAQAKVVEELARGRVERRTAGRLAMAYRVDPAASLQRLDDLRRDGDAADVLDVPARHRLPVGDDGERLHHRARVARRLFRVEALDVRLELDGGLESPAARHVHQLARAPLPLFGQLRQQISQRVGAQIAAEQALELGQTERLLRGEQRSFEDAFYVSWAVHTLI